MSLFKFMKPKRLELHAMEPDETWYQRAYWLTLLVKTLKAEVAKLSAENEQLLRQLNLEGMLTPDQQELLNLRDQVQELSKTKAKLEKRLRGTAKVNEGLIDELHDLRHGIDRAA